MADRVIYGINEHYGDQYVESKGDHGGETLHLRTTFDATSGQNGLAKNARFRVDYLGEGDMPKFTSLANTFYFYPQTNGTYTSTTEIIGCSTRFTSGGIANSTTIVLPKFTGYLSGVSGTATHTYTMTDGIYHFYAQDFGALTGTQAKETGLWIEKMTTGTNNYGIVLDGENDGSDIVFGGSQQLSLSRDATTGLLTLAGGGLDIYDNAIVVGSNVGTNIRGDGWGKEGSVVVPHKILAEEHISMIGITQAGTANQFNLGGGDAAYNAATEIRFYTAADYTTLVGTIRMFINSAGNIGIGASPTANMAGLSIEQGLLTLKETTTPTADADYGKIYTKNDNKIYFQSGDGTEHEIAYV